MKLIIVMAILITCLPSLVSAHGDQEIIYLGTECRLRGDLERGETTAACTGTPLGTPWRDLVGVSVFGSLSNLHTCPGTAANVGVSRVPDFRSRAPGEMVVTCPIPRGAIRKSSGIEVFVKVETTIDWRQNDNESRRINKNLRCELLNINAAGNGSSVRDTTGNIVVTSSALTFRESGIAEFGLSLGSSNAADSLRADDAGGYALTCVLPGVRDGKPSRIIQYSVRERD